MAKEKEIPVFTALELSFVSEALDRYRIAVENTDFKEGSMITKEFCLGEIDSSIKKLDGYFKDK